MISKRTFPDLWLLVAILGLLMTGIVIIYSAGDAWAKTKGMEDTGSFFINHIGKVGIGAFAMAIAMFIPPRIWKRYALPLLIFGVILCLLVHVPGIGKKELGATRWLRFPLVWQPSEFLRIVFALALAAYLDRNIAR